MYVIQNDAHNKHYCPNRYFSGYSQININSGLNIKSLKRGSGFLLRNKNINATDYKETHHTKIRIAIILTNTKIKSDSVNVRFDKIIVSDNYPMFDQKIITKFQIVMNSNYIDAVCYYGFTKILDFWKKTCQCLNYSRDVMTIASSNNNVNILEWWLNSNLPFKYSKIELDEASSKGYINVLQWWKCSGLMLKYSIKTLDYASFNDHVDVLDWWFNSGLELKYSEKALEFASYCGNVRVLQWWKNSNLELKYSTNILHSISIAPKENRSAIQSLWRKMGII